jgi:nucleoside-diphosphate-sugar epimerase
MTVLVTGGAGRIGSAVVRNLLAHGHDVRVLTQEPPPEPLPVDTVVGDCGDPAVVNEALAGVSALAHLAAIPTPTELGEEVFVNNTRATFVVLDRAGQAGVEHAVITSSISALGLAWGRPGMSPLYVPIDEDHPNLAEDPYALSKQVDELTGLMMHRRYGINVLAFRLPFTAETSRLNERAERVRSDPAAASRELWAWLHTDDAADAFRLGIEQKVAGFHVCYVMADETLSDEPTEALVERYHPTAEVRAPLIGRDVPYTTDRARQLFGFRATRAPSGEPQD